MVARHPQSVITNDRNRQSQSVAIGAISMEMVTAIDDSTWTIDQARRPMAHVTSRYRYRGLL